MYISIYKYVCMSLNDVSDEHIFEIPFVRDCLLVSYSVFLFVCNFLFLLLRVGYFRFFAIVFRPALSIPISV